MPFTMNNDARLAWDEAGAGSPVLLVMGHRYSSAMWYPILPALTAAHRVVWFDNRGTGESDTTDNVSMNDLATDALAVMNAAGLERAHLFGVSMGGVIVQEIAQLAPERVTSLIVGCSGVLDAEKPRMPAFMRIIYYLPSWLLKALTPNRRGDQGYGTAAPKDAITKDQAVLAKDKFTVKGVVGQAKAIAGYTTTKEAIAMLTMPALVLHGDEDTVVPFKWGVELAETLPNSRFVAVEGAGHNFIVAGREKSTRALLDFLEEVDNAPPQSCAATADI